MERLRTSRVAEQMKKEISEIVNQKLKDPRIGFVTITDVELTNDLQQATVYITVLGDETAKKDTLVGLQKATGFIRTEVGKTIRLRKTPDITFKYDHAQEYGSRIESLLKEINEKEE